MANYTENLNLKKPEENDFYNIEDFNGNADILDGEIVKKADISAYYDGKYVLTTLKGKNITVDISDEENLLTVTYVNSDNSIIIRNFRILHCDDKITASMLEITPAQIGAASSTHTHSASDITSGTLPTNTVTITPEQSDYLPFSGTIKAIPALKIVIIDGYFAGDSLSAGNSYKLGTLPSAYASKNAKYTPLNSSTGQVYVVGTSVYIKTDSAVSANEKISVSGFWCY